MFDLPRDTTGNQPGKRRNGASSEFRQSNSDERCVDALRIDGAARVFAVFPSFTTPLLAEKKQLFMSITSNPHPTATDAAPALAATAPLTYEQLLHHGCMLAAQEGMQEQQVKNLASALRQWIARHGFSTSRLVGDDFAGNFDELFRRHCDDIAEDLAQRSQRDRQELLLRWRRIAKLLRRQDTLPQDFGAALAQCLKASSMSMAALAREVGLSPTAIRHWIAGKGWPIGSTLQHVTKIETVLELPVGALTSRVPLARRTRYERGVVKRDTTTSFTKTVRKQRLAFRRRTLPYAGRIRDQWQRLGRFKTDSFREGARAHNTWRLKPIERSSSDITAPMLVDGQICITSGAQWLATSPFLGWLATPAPNGLDMPLESADTLAWLSHSEYVVQYARWMIRRSDNKFHNGVNVFLQYVESHLRPGSGFVWMNSDLRSTLPEDLYLQLTADIETSGVQAVWREHCELARKKIRDFRYKAIDQMGVRRSRDPVERASAVLNDEFPLRKLVDFVERLERSMPPPAHGRDYRAWLRNVVLCRMLISNPIRVGQYAAMTYRADGTGNLIRVAPGRYRMRFEPSDFKNEKGAAKEGYDVEVPLDVGKWIDRYLTEARPYLPDAEDSDRFFLMAVKGNRKQKAHLAAEGLDADAGPTGQALYTCFKILTSKYCDDCPGFGPHTVRHAIATDHLRRHPGDYLTVAKLLHDKLETVLKNYSHLRVQDGLRVLHAGIAQASHDLAAARGKV